VKKVGRKLYFFPLFLYYQNNYLKSYIQTSYIYIYFREERLQCLGF